MASITLTMLPRGFVIIGAIGTKRETRTVRREEPIKKPIWKFWGPSIISRQIAASFPVTDWYFFSSRKISEPEVYNDLMDCFDDPGTMDFNVPIRAVRKTDAGKIEWNAAGGFEVVDCIPFNEFMDTLCIRYRP